MLVCDPGARLGDLLIIVNMKMRPLIQLIACCLCILLQAGISNSIRWLFTGISLFAKQFTCEKPFEFIKVDLDKKLKDLRDEFSQKLKGKIDGTEVALSIASGDGKEHMALISALINLPVGIRFAALTKDGVIDL